MVLFALCALMARPAQAQTPAQAESDSLSEKTKTEGVKKHYMRPGGPPTFEEEKEKFFRQLRERGKPPLEPQTAPVDSLTIKEKIDPPLLTIENEGLRLLTKVAAGTASGVVFTYITYWSLIDALDDALNEGSYYYVEGIIFSAFIGWSVGFPLGVTLVDPYDSSLKTLLAGVIPGAMGIGLFLMSQYTDGWLVNGGWLVLPAIISLNVSDQSRKPPQDRRISFGLAPILNGGFSSVATLHF